ncbi:hypothetical protein [Paenibacillus sp. Marseille-Q4541]|uniref:hypothetical protein n=1 Tax=Paenibacillus sp. Marseille-Q4541 TaxID=2831522 RepID=UPI001BAC82E2|nr:hypothetical protein [Paenibacillus sp. Marseille-Q4541]
MNKYLVRIASAALLGSLMMGQASYVMAQPAAVITEAETEEAGCGHTGHYLYFMEETAQILKIDTKTLAGEMEQGKTIADIAKTKGMTSKQLEEKLKPAVEQRVDEAVKAGCLTKEQAASMKTSIGERLDKVINTPMSELRQKHSHHGKGQSKLNRESIAKFLGITTNQLNQELQQGKSLAEIAKAKGISEKQLIDHLKEQLTPDLNKFIHRKIRMNQGPGKEALKNEIN